MYSLIKILVYPLGHIMHINVTSLACADYVWSKWILTTVHIWRWRRGLSFLKGTKFGKCKWTRDWSSHMWIVSLNEARNRRFKNNLIAEEGKEKYFDDHKKHVWCMRRFNLTREWDIFLKYCWIPYSENRGREAISHKLDLWVMQELPGNSVVASLGSATCDTYENENSPHAFMNVGVAASISS